MQTARPPEIFVPIDDFTSNSQKFFDRLRKTGEAAFLTVDYKPAAVAMSPETYERLAKNCLDWMNSHPKK